MNKLVFVVLSIIFISCKNQSPADLLVTNGTIYTLDSQFSTCQAMAIKGGRIIATGTTAALSKQFLAKENIDAKGGFIFPGFIDAHGHFFEYALTRETVDLVGTDTWQDVVQRLSAGSKTADKDSWLIGSGWDQNDWPVKQFPTKDTLDALFPDRPVYLTRVDGHAAIVNQKALDIAEIHPGQTLIGGQIEMKDGKLTGILVDNAVRLVSSKIPPPTIATISRAMQKAQANCFGVGLTTVDDCGLDNEVVLGIDSLQKAGLLKMRIYAMLSDKKKNFVFASNRGKIKTDFLNVRSFKVYADGALGSRGACLLQPYADKPGWTGFLLSSAAHFDSVAGVIKQLGFQMCTHAIGDSGNRVILQTYARHLNGKNDLRWRIEHAQVVDPADVSLFGANSIIPSMQPTHATSDMYWAATRLGSERVKSAYALKTLLQQNGWLPLGTDFPVEDISPFKTLYAAVARMDAKGFPAGGFQMENALTREDALRGITIWAARANFEEQEKGSLEKGKFADFVIVDKDLVHAPAADILQTKVISTFVGGQAVYKTQ